MNWVPDLWIAFQIIKQKDGRSRGFAFVTMASGQEAQAVVEKFDSYVSVLQSAFKTAKYYQCFGPANLTKGHVKYVLART